jgi:phosphoribosylanthranilate isomerase
MAQVKICGLSESATMQAALDGGADMVGLVFFARSPRNVSMERAARLADQARGKAAIVTLVVDAEDALLSQITETLRPDYIQAHGSETPQRIADIHALTKTPIIKAIKVESSDDVTSAVPYQSAAAMILYDAKAPKDLLPGGNGLSFDWKLLEGVKGQYMLSGGLTSDNVAQAIRLTQAPIVDVSSGVETSPGVKDAGLIAKFIRVAKSAGNEDSL